MPNKKVMSKPKKSKLNKATPELIVLSRLNHLPRGSMLQKSPLEQDEAQAWAAFYKAKQIYYWPGTKSVFIVKELVDKKRIKRASSRKDLKTEPESDNGSGNPCP